MMMSQCVVVRRGAEEADIEWNGVELCSIGERGDLYLGCFDIRRFGFVPVLLDGDLVHPHLLD